VEAPLTEVIWQEYLGNEEDKLAIIASGFDWNQPYSCQGWAEAFGISYLMIDDSNNEAWNLFGEGYIPHNVVLDHNMEVIYTGSGYNESQIIEAIEYGLSYIPRDIDLDSINDDEDNCEFIYNPGQEDSDSDGSGDMCDSCDNLNIFIQGNINGSLQDGVPSINIFDVLNLVDVVLSNESETCRTEASDMNNDNNLNIIDVIQLVQNLLQGNL
jgi:hypothetical protein